MPTECLVCRHCGATYPLRQHYSCAQCGGILEVRRTFATGDREVVLRGGRHFRRGLWKYFEMLPVADPANVVSLGEGDTPLLRDERLPDHWRRDISLLIKAESLNPTGSFKDRPTSVGLSVARELGQDTVVVSSSGNAAASTAAYAARAGMRCVVVVPESVDPGKLAQAHAHGARVLGVRGSFSNCFALARELSGRFGWTNLVSTFLNPYTVEADKTIAYELREQMDGGVPDCIFVPIGSGPLLAGVFKGYREMLALGLTRALPRMIGVQAEACEPITRAFLRGEPVRAWDGPMRTMAGGIADPLVGYEQDGDLTIRVVRESGGVMLSLSETEVAEATRLLETKVGLYSEPTGAVAVGAVKKLCDAGGMAEGETAVCLMTGHGFKYGKRDVPEMRIVETLDQACEALA